MSARNRYGGEAYGGSTLALGGITGSGLSVPGYAPAYFWTTSSSSQAHGQAAYGGRRSVTFPSAGLSAAPDPDSGTVTIPLFWAYAREVLIARVDEVTGVRVPVRGAAPFNVSSGVSRRNGDSNPKAAIDLAGTSAGANTTLTRLTSLVTPVSTVTTGYRGTASAAGSVTMTNNADAANTTPRTYGFYARTSVAATAIRLSIQWFNESGGTVATQNYDVNVTARTQAVNAWSWCAVTVDTFPSGAVVGTVSYVATGLPSGGTLDVTARVNEPRDSFLGRYFDGDELGGAWTGTPSASYSDLAPLFHALDGEAPLDTPFRYEMSSPSVPGFTAVSQTVSLSSRGNRTWLTHPGKPSNPIRVEIIGPIDAISRSVERGIYYPLDSSDGLPIVRTQARRRGRVGALTFLAVDHHEWHRLVDLFSDGAPVLIRPPATYGYGATLWLSLGDLSEENPAHFSEFKYRKLSAPFTEVAAPLIGVA